MNLVNRLNALVLASLLFAAAPARADDARPVVVTVDDGSDVAVDEVRRAIAAELGGRVAPAGADAPDGAGRVQVRSRGGVITVTFRDARGRTLTRDVTAPADGASRVRLIALLAGNLARNEAEELLPRDERASELVLRVAPGAWGRAEIDARPGAADPRASEPPAPSTPAAPAAPAAPAPEPARDGATQRTLGWLAVGTGAASLTAGAVLGVLALKDRERVDSLCVTPQGVCTMSAYASLQQARALGVASVLALGTGAALALTGVILELTAPSGKSTTLALSPTRLLLTRTF